MKFIHTSDLHYGAAPDANKPWGRERAQAVKNAFNKIIEACKTEEADLLLIAGDLFDSIPDEQEIAEVNEAFASIPKTRVAIIPGRNEKITHAFPQVTFEWAPNVTYVINDNGPAVYFDEVNNIYMTVEEPEEIIDSDKYSYVALGGRHKPSALVKGNMAYSGSPEPITSADTSAHGYYIGKIHPQTRELCSFKFVTLDTVRYISLVVNVTPETKNEEVVDNIRSEILKRGKENIYRLRIKGMSSPEVEFDLSTLTTNFRISDIVDQTEPKYDYLKLYAEHSDDMVGFFIREMNKSDKTDIQRKALTYGINALLKTADERN